MGKVQNDPVSAVFQKENAPREEALGRGRGGSANLHCPGNFFGAHQVNPLVRSHLGIVVAGVGEAGHNGLPAFTLPQNQGAFFIAGLHAAQEPSIGPKEEGFPVQRVRRKERIQSAKAAGFQGSLPFGQRIRRLRHRLPASMSGGIGLFPGEGILASRGAIDGHRKNAIPGIGIRLPLPMLGVLEVGYV